MTEPVDTAQIRTALLAVLPLKRMPRAGWLRVGVDAPESVAAHAWGVAWLVAALCPPALDLGRCLEIAIVHDVAEVRVGDITPHDGVDPADKAARERAAMGELTAALPRGAALLAAFEAYEAATTPEARFVKACDKLDMALQAAHYEAMGAAAGLEEFVDSALARLDPGLLHDLANPGVGAA